MILGRVLAVHGHKFLVLTPDAERMLPAIAGLPFYPVTGDVVRIEQDWIRGIEARRSVVERKAPGSATEKQTIAANIDLLFIVTGLDSDFNLRRMERYLVMANQSGAEPVLVLTKADMCDRVAERAAEVQELAPVPVIVSSSLNSDGAEAIRRLLSPDKTGALIGSSGAGKSTLINLLLRDERQRVGAVGESGGRHTTTHRQMFRIPESGWLMDQPGLREIQILADEQAVTDAFADIASLAEQCRYRDCRHQGEPGCAVTGTVDAARLTNFQKLQKEAARAVEEFDIAQRIKNKQKLKAVHKAARDRDWD
jgi:ribosome biogenesis GTPase